jgi:peptidoglycan hydrolase CwlO-like protein
MKTKKDVFGVVGVILFVLAVSVMGDYGNIVSSAESSDDVPYEEIVADIDDTLIETYSNNKKIRSLNEDLEVHRDNLEDVLHNYTSLEEEIKKITENIEKLEKEINKTNSDSDRLREKRIKLQNKIESDPNEIKAGNGIKAWLFYLSLFISVNLFIWFEISTYYREKNFNYRKF